MEAPDAVDNGAAGGATRATGSGGVDKHQQKKATGGAVANARSMATGANRTGTSGATGAKGSSRVPRRTAAVKKKSVGVLAKRVQLARAATGAKGSSRVPRRTAAVKKKSVGVLAKRVQLARAAIAAFQIDETAVPVGLENPTRTYCYFNVVLQALQAFPGLLQELVSEERQWNYDLKSEQEPPLGRVFIGYLNKIQNGANRFNANVVKEAVAVRSGGTFAGAAEEDGQEFFSALVDLLIMEWNETSKTMSPLRRDMWIGVGKELECQKCELAYCTRLKLHERELMLQLEFAPEVKVTTLSEMITYALRKEFIKDGKCGSCKGAGLSCNLFVWHWPQILVLHLKRFQFRKGGVSKIDTVVQVPQELRAPSAGGTYCTFSLRAIIVHLQLHKNAGHYICGVCKGHKWYMCDDAKVTELEKSPYDIEEIRENIYILFYEKQKEEEK